ncbi:hypothetical protein SAMN05444360_13319 [Chryseobacterium carnipullorum]|uniref:hypothetical protein n=1 Tax=Chryseobacterium carnipullorum TaxID=1124835 RepID=UPI000919D047|nr:hypothetical protein [Chryseobacterium carnipullorum]SHN06339.1 hypothetical protein SAMN05444360_13319 [Chryseobacterium carnipullorum]
MKNFILFYALLFGFLFSCNKPNLPKKYTIEVQQNTWSDMMGDDYQSLSEEITAKNVDEAYYKGYKSYISKQIDAEDFNGEMARRIIISFRVLDEDRKNIVTQVSQKSLDSIHQTVDKQTNYKNN